MKEDNKKKDVTIDKLNNIIKSKETKLTNIIDRHQVSITSLQTALENSERKFTSKFDAVIQQGSDNFALLDKKLDNLGGKLLGPTIAMITQAESKISEMGMDRELL